MYKTLSTKTLLTHSRLTVMEDQLQLPGGETGEYIWFAGRRDGVGVIARRDDGSVLIQEEYSYIPAARLYQLPGGGVEPGETAEAAANRELAEEAGLFANRLTLLGSYFTDHRRSASRMHLFLAEDLEEREAHVKDKYEVDLTNTWMTVAEIDSLIANGLVVNVHLLAGWLLYQSNGSTSAR